MPFRLFPRSRKPSVGGLVGTMQAARRLSRESRIRMERDPISSLKKAERRS